jgi:(+)-trans-carveol dehydrogenase
MGRVEGRVAFVTGAARGQGRSHAVRLAEEGADIVAVDLCGQIDTVPYPMATLEDLAVTAALVEKSGREVVTAQADVRDLGALQAAVDEGLARFGHLDIVVANAGITTYAPVTALDDRVWRDTIDVNLTGVWHTCRAAVPPLIERGRGGSLVLTSSTAGLKGIPNLAHYAAAKHGVVGLGRALAVELAPHRIRVNTVSPTTVATDLLLNDATFRLFRPDLPHPTVGDALDAFTGLNALPVPWVQPRDISDAVLWLASDEARYVTGITLPVDAGALSR